MKVLEIAKTKLGNEIKLIGNPVKNGVLIIGVFHGDEPQGKFLIEEYMRRENSYSDFALEKAKELRKNCTDAEKALWQILRAKRFYGLKFRRQQPIGHYIVDFVCTTHKLIIELDGGQHNEEDNIKNDKERTLYLENLGYKVLRIWNNDIFQNIEGVVEQILMEISTSEQVNSSLMFIPCLNPDGMELGQRTNSNGVDLNRNFPTKNWGKNEGENATCDDSNSSYYGGVSAASEIETKFVIEVIEKYQPKCIVTLHAPYKVVNYDGPSQKVAQKISEIIGYPVEGSIGYPTPGSFGTYCGVERNIPTITLELDEEIPVENLIEPVFEVFDMDFDNYLQV